MSKLDIKFVLYLFFGFVVLFTALSIAQSFQPPRHMIDEGSSGLKS